MDRRRQRLVTYTAAAVSLLLMLWGGGCRGREPEPPIAEPSSNPTASSAAVTTEAAPTTRPFGETPEEVRAVWVTYAELQTLFGGRSAAQAGEALEALLDRLSALHINTVFFHVRANSDAYYASDSFAVAAWAGPLLRAGWDPLRCAVEAAHARGMQLHAWINPFRIGRDAAVAVCGDTFAYNGAYYYIPSSDTVQRQILNGVRELLDGYAVDGIHFDDYFYPAGAVPAEEPAEFEAEAFAAYREAGGTAAVGDWRRLQVDRLVAAVCQLAHRSGRVFGISPAARPEYCRETLYADVERWMTVGGYVDYLCPQLYFGLQNDSMPFEEVLRRFAAMPRHESVRLYIGLPVYKAGMRSDSYAGAGAGEWASGGNVLARELRLLRAMPQVDGFALYASSYLTEETHPGIGDAARYEADVVRSELRELAAALTARES